MSKRAPAGGSPGGPDDGFASLVEDALEHLYDFAYLQTHPLVDRLQPESGLPARERMRLLRTTLLEAIGELNPGPGVAFRSLQARAYNVLNLRYVAGMTVEAVARELGISDRQLYRDLRKAEHDVAALLWSRRPGASADAETATAEELLLREAERLASAGEEVCVRSLLEGTLAALARLSEQFGVTIEAALPDSSLTIWTDRLLAKQALLNALSHAVQRATPGATIAVSAQPQGSRVRIQIRYVRQGAPGSAEDTPLPAEQLIRRLGGQWLVASGPAGPVTMTATLGDRRQTSVLLIDDNEGLHELFRRYLPDEHYRLNVANSGREGLRLAEEIAPDIIVLDVMMPQEDGWEVLQSLCNRPQTRGIPVIVCSVLNDPQLALSLGAAGFLAKPVKRTELLLALSRCRQDSRTRSNPGLPAST